MPFSPDAHDRLREAKRKAYEEAMARAREAQRRRTRRSSQTLEMPGARRPRTDRA